MTWPELIMSYNVFYSWSSVNKANALENPLAALPSFQVYNRNDVNLVIEAKKVTDLDTVTRDWIADLMERNMKEMYVKSEWGWNAENKKAELMEEAAWYLLAREADTNIPLAFSHFRSTVGFQHKIYIFPNTNTPGPGSLYSPIKKRQHFTIKTER